MLVILLLAAVLPAAERPPNIILLLADDLGWGDVGFNGRTDWRTPNLDRLAKEGMVLRRCYAAGAVCAPSRAALLTGQYGIHNGVVANPDDLPAETVTIAAALKERGYATGLFGKWHHGKPRPGRGAFTHPLDLGFDELFGFTDARQAWEHFPKELDLGRERKPVQGYADTLFADHGIDFIRRHRDRPFFLYLPFTATHLHIEAPPEDVAEFRGKFTEKDPAKPVNATYAAMVTRLDREIGRVLRTLDELKLADETLIVFSSDQGATFEVGNQGASNFHDSNRPFRGQKRTLWEGGIRVPSVVRWPAKVPAGKVSSELVHFIDLFPTFLAAAGGELKPAWQRDGRNVLPVWRGSEKGPERTLFWEWRAEGDQQLAAMRGDWKLVITGGNRPELFNVEGDPTERRSVSEEHPERAKQLQQELDVWLATETEAAKWGKETPRSKER
jgi:arylsulfatase A-like enzyme